MPLLVRCFDSDAPGNRRSDFTQSIDLAPTLLNWFGAASQMECDGESLLYCIRDEKSLERTQLFLGDDDGPGVPGSGHEASNPSVVNRVLHVVVVAIEADILVVLVRVKGPGWSYR